MTLRIKEAIKAIDELFAQYDVEHSNAEEILLTLQQRKMSREDLNSEWDYAKDLINVLFSTAGAVELESWKIGVGIMSKGVSKEIESFVSRTDETISGNIVKFKDLKDNMGLCRVTTIFEFADSNLSHEEISSLIGEVRVNIASLYSYIEAVYSASQYLAAFMEKNNA